jgi:S1-C subfamily serine protease
MKHFVVSLYILISAFLLGGLSVKAFPDYFEVHKGLDRVLPQKEVRPFVDNKTTNTKKHYKKIVHFNPQTVGRLDVFDQEVKLIGAGSFFAISSTEYMTAAHVCRPALETNGYLVYDNKTTFQVVKISDNLDLCLMEGRPNLLRITKIARSYPPLYSKVLVAGYPLGIDLLLTDGYLTNKTFVIPGGKYPPKILVSVPSFGGNSGGVILNQRMELIGVLVMGVGMYHHISLGTQLEQIKNFLEF